MGVVGMSRRMGVAPARHGWTANCEGFQRKQEQRGRDRGGVAVVGSRKKV